VPQTPDGSRTLAALGLKADQLPAHVAIIMDGNGRWAQRRGRPRMLGHRAGLKSVRVVLEEACQLGLEQLTLYCLSIENWKRPSHELAFLMRLLRHYLKSELPRMQEQNIRLAMIGRRDGLPRWVLHALDSALEATARNTGLVLCLAINYGGRTELADAARRLAIDVQAGRLDPSDIDEDRLAAYLSTVGMPDPDLLIRTAGELRISNFLLWQVSYSELWVTEVLWPDFRPRDLHQALLAFAKRQRKFGALPVPEPRPVVP
jgi:undecaprenyl diphosphate synthase